MPFSRRSRWLLAPAMLVAVLLFAAPAFATSWGEVGKRFTGVGTGAEKGKKFVLTVSDHAFGVDSKENSVFVGDQVNEEESEGPFRIQKYSETGEWQGEVRIPSPPGVLPAGTARVGGIEGIAVDPALGRIYVLTVYARSGSVKDPEQLAAGALYAFKTTPVGKTLVPAEGANSEGILVGADKLKPGAETPDQALLNPAGITVDPKTHEVVILGEKDEAPFTLEHAHIALARISSAGAIGTEFVVPKQIGEEEENAPGSSPVVSEAGELYFEKSNEILATSLESAPANPTVVFTFGQNLVRGAFHEELAALDEPATEAGGGLTLKQEGAKAGTLFTSGEITRMEEHGKAAEAVPGAIGIAFEEGAGAPKTHELGWTGGVASEEAKPCALEFGENYPLVAFGGGGNLFVLTSRTGAQGQTGEVVRLGPGGEHCPTARAVSPVEASIGGFKITEPETSHAVTLSVNVQGANVTSTKWFFGDGQSGESTGPAGEQSQVAEVEHRFNEGGSLKVEAQIHTDDLATPELVVSTIIKVKSNGTERAPEMTLQPLSQKVSAGEPVVFEAKASGEPAPTAQWELSTNKGGSWAPVVGATSEKLEVAATKVSETGNEYRETFKNKSGEVTSKPATLTVTLAAPKVTQQPTSIDALEGENVAFEAKASGEPTVQWEISTDAGTSWTPIANATTEKLVVEKVELAQSHNEYRAVFKNGTGEATSEPAALTVAPFQPPVVELQPKSREEGEGGEVTFEAKATGAPEPTMQWEVSANGGATWTVIGGANKEKLTVGNVNFGQNGWFYRATFTNKAGTKSGTAVSESATLKVTVRPPKVIHQPANRSVLEGESAIFEATASGGPTVQWQVSTNNGTTWGNVGGATSTRLVLPGVTVAQNGYRYRALFRNEAPTEKEVLSSAATLTVTAKPSTGCGSCGGGGAGGGGGGGGGGVLPHVETKLPPAPKAFIAGTSLTASKSGAVTIKVSCPTGASCTGTVTLKTLTAVAATASKHASKKILTLATASFSVTGGQVRSIQLHLSAKGKQLLARLHSLRVKATVFAHDSSGQSSTTSSVLTLRPAKAKKKH